MILARNLYAKMDPPKEEARWILARLAMISAIALQLEMEGLIPAPPLNPKTLVHLLCAEWDDELRRQWIEIGRMERRKRHKRIVRLLILALFALILLAGMIVRLRR